MWQLCRAELLEQLACLRVTALAAKLYASYSGKMDTRMRS